MILKRNLFCYGYKIDLLLLPFFIAMVYLLLNLGFWQIHRLEEKETLINRISSNINSAPKNLAEIALKDLIYSKITLEGHFLQGYDLFLYGRRSGMTEKDGYYLLSPFQTDDGKIIMVSRGWLSHSHKDQVISRLNEHLAHKKINGIILPGEKKSPFIPSNDNKNRIWFTLDLKDASNFLSRNVEDFYLAKIGKTEFSPLNPILEQHFIKIRNDHKEYAITWFGLAFAAVIMFGFYTFKISKNA
jgi:surfeit locus 1 family protein